MTMHAALVGSRVHVAFEPVVRAVVDDGTSLRVVAVTGYLDSASAEFVRLYAGELFMQAADDVRSEPRRVLEEPIELTVRAGAVVSMQLIEEDEELFEEDEEWDEEEDGEEQGDDAGGTSA